MNIIFFRQRGRYTYARVFDLCIIGGVRVISYYHYVLRRPEHKRYKRVRSLGGVESFVQWACTTGKICNQADMLCDEQDNLIVDYVGRFESLPEDFQRICDRLRISVVLPHANKSNYGDFVTLEAPGFATLPVGYKGDPGTYAGTSISAAYVANRVADYLAQNPNASVEEILRSFRPRD